LYSPSRLFVSLFLNAPPPTEISTLSLHDALPICIIYFTVAVTGLAVGLRLALAPLVLLTREFDLVPGVPGSMIRIDDWHWNSPQDRKSTRLNSSHRTISYAVFCLKKKNNTGTQRI